MRAFFLMGLLLAATLPGCQQPIVGEAWTPLTCDPGQVDRIGGNVEVLPHWNRSVQQRATGYAAAAGHELGAHRSSGPRLHEWALYDPEDTYLGQLELRSMTMPEGQAAQFRLTSAAGLPEEEPVAWARDLVRSLAGDVALDEQVLDDAGILQVEFYQAYEGFRLVDTATLDGGLSAFRLHNGATELRLRPFYDLEHASLEVPAEDAITTALAYFDCSRDQKVIVVGWELAVMHDSLAYAVDLRDANPDVFSCIPPILVDAMTGAVLGQASLDVCALPDA